MAVRKLPDGQRIFPYLTVVDASKAIDFYRAAFGAREVVRLADPSGKVGYAELSVGEARFMLSDPYPELGVHPPEAEKNPPVSVSLYVEDPDATVDRAVTLGATVERPVEDQFHGHRLGFIVDPFGHRWAIQCRTEDVPPDELKRRFDAMMTGD